MDIVIKNGTVVNALDIFKADIGIANGKIVAIGQDLTGTENIDATGKYILPGLVDVHTEMESALAGTRTIDNFWTGTRSAACGGVTTMIDVVWQLPGESLHETLKNRRRLADSQVTIDYSLHLGITQYNEMVQSELPELLRDGLPSLLVMLSSPYPEQRLAESEILPLMALVGEAGGLVGVRADNHDLFQFYLQRMVHGHKTGPENYPILRPVLGEADMAQRMLGYAEALHVALHLFEVSSQAVLTHLSLTPGLNRNISAGTSPQYLTHNSEVYHTPEGVVHLTDPPLRPEANQSALWQGIRRGDIQTIASAHRAFTQEQKRVSTDLLTVPLGLATVETMLPVLYTKGVVGKQIDLRQLVNVLATTPARLFGLKHKGSIAIHKDADLVIFNPAEKKIITASALHSESDYTIYEGLEVQGYPETTIARGKIVYDQGKFTGEQGAGNFIARHL